mgnify:CR=1 FL=1
MIEVFKSSRFQSLVILAVVGLLKAYGVVSEEIYQALLVILGGHIGIRTVDRISDKIGG